MPLERYRFTADPQVAGATGNRFYGTNTDRVIYADLAYFATHAGGGTARAWGRNQVELPRYGCKNA